MILFATKEISNAHLKLWIFNNQSNKDFCITVLFNACLNIVSDFLSFVVSFQRLCLLTQIQLNLVSHSCKTQQK